MSQRTRRIVIPPTARVGETIKVRSVIQHPMVTGHTDAGSNTAQRKIVHTFTVVYLGTEVLRVDLGPGIAANPYFALNLLAKSTGDVVFTWVDDTGEVIVETRTLTVT